MAVAKIADQSREEDCEVAFAKITGKQTLVLLME